MRIFSKLLVKLGHGLGLPPRYKLLKIIGAGAEGEVWLGLDEDTQTLVALKLIPRGAPAWKLDMARREFSTLAQLGPGHLNIVRPLEVVLTSKHLVLITEYVPGGSLSDHLGRHPMSEDAARYFFKQLLDAVAFCHGRKIVYRDIKPANVLITGTQPPFLKLCDFGLADSWEGRPGPCFRSLVGTPGFMAPEIMSSFFSGAAELARRSRDASGAGSGPARSSRSADAAAMPGTRSHHQQQQQQRAEAAVAAAAAAAGALRHSSSGAALAAAAAAAGSDGAAGQGAGGAQVPRGARASSCTSAGGVGGMKRSSSAQKLAALAAKAAAVMPGGSSLSRSLAARAAAGSDAVAGSSGGVTDAQAEAELAAVPTYDGEKADVYSLGVLLVVMLLRRMPWNYDAYADRLPLLKAMRALYDTAVVHKVDWRSATPNADSLSPQLSALLDGMLAADPAQRLSMRQVADSEWMQLPLPPKLQCAIEVLSEQQQLREARYAADAADAADRGYDSDACAAAAAAIQQQLDAMIAAAQMVGNGFKLQARLSLTQQPGARVRAPPKQQQQKEKEAKEAQQQQQQHEGVVVGSDKDSVSDDGCAAAIITTPLASGDFAAAAAAGGGAAGTAAMGSAEGMPAPIGAAAAAGSKGGAAGPAIDLTVQVA